MNNNENQGVILIWMAFTLPIAFILLGFVVDIGYQLIIRADLQNAAQAGSHAGVLDLNLGIEQGILSAKKQIIKNTGSHIELLDNNIKITTGRWNRQLKIFHATTKKPNAMKVKLSKTAHFFFSKQINFGLFNTYVTSIAYYDKSDGQRNIVLVQ